jgi:hypothetical protein
MRVVLIKRTLNCGAEFYEILGKLQIIMDIKSKDVKAHQFFHQILGLKSTLLAKNSLQN